MALSTYAGLQAAIAATLNRDDLTAVIPDWITLAEAQHARDIRHWRMETRANATFDAQYTALPDDWIETRRLTMGNATLGYRALALASTDEMERYRAGTADVAGVPRYYAHRAGSIEVWPTPSGEHTDAEMTYLAKIPALSDSATSNWLLTHAPDAYLYGALLHAAPYLVADERLPVWQSLYDRAVAALNAASSRAATSGTAFRLRPPR